ncbi:glycosyltransferase family 2 protein [Candidatus Micrarchaeota archaeon]|nr:glycosyltransferase family 2 protein [Candidatus Micrarchaeota archaeon]
MKKIAIFIPTYNAAQTLPIVLDRIPREIKQKVKEIFVVDNNSSDNTYMTAVQYKSKSKLNNLKIIKNERNLGYGGSQKKAYKYVLDKGYDIVVMLHGDAQYAPELIPQLLKPVEEGKADLVFGSRMKGNPLKGGMPFYRLIGNKVLTAIENYVLEMNLSEYHSGYRVYSCAALRKLPFEKCSNDYHFDTDILIQSRIKNLKIKEIPIPTHYGKESHSPTIVQLIKYTLNILKAMLDYWLHRKGIAKIKKFDI